MSFDSFDQLKDDAEERALAVEFDGLTLPWLPDGLAIGRASEQGVEIGDVLARFESMSLDGVDPEAFAAMSEEEQEKLLANDEGRYKRLEIGLQASADFLWIGFLRFKPDLDRDLIRGKMDVTTIGELPLDEMMSKVGGGGDPQMADEGN